jgi:hypothetical protein
MEIQILVWKPILADHGKEREPNGRALNHACRNEQ